MASKAQLDKQQQLQSTYQNYKTTLQNIASKIGDIEQETEEHKLVLETLEPLPGDRKCFRMINGVLTERTVADIVPILQTNQDGLKKTLEELVKQYKTRQDEMEKWKKKNNVQVVQQPGQ
ncbi:Cochaperone prefoldin complex subunit [Didymella sp. IMI 355093]|nr:Cochaperone prefoldin complex subunit [Didymella sp. IMI 355093]